MTITKNKTVLKLLEERKQLLIDALLYRKIDQNTYDQQLEKLRIDLGSAEARLADAELDQIDIEEVLAYAEEVFWCMHLACGVNHLWTTNSASNRFSFQMESRFQKKDLEPLKVLQSSAC